MRSLSSAAAATFLALFITAPSVANHPTSDPAGDLEIAADEIDALEDLVSHVSDYRMRRAMLTRVYNAEMAIHRARYELEFGQGGSYGRPGYQGGGTYTRPGRGHGYGNGYGGSYQNPSTLSYEDARAIVSRESFDSGKVEALRKVASKGRFTTEQAKNLADMCDFDSGKREALVALYPAVTDQARYMLALDILDFPSSRRWVEEQLGI